ncbi:MAG: hypothetical protein R3E48_09980 [Burkholderiaceae bacterium]
MPSDRSNGKPQDTGPDGIAAIWDFGGVITESPFEAFERYEAERGLPPGFLRSVNARDPHTNAWARLERSECTLDAFDAAFADESAALGHRVPGLEVLALLDGAVRPPMAEAVRRIGRRLKTGCITNNFRADAGRSPNAEAKAASSLPSTMSSKAPRSACASPTHGST